MHASLRRGYAAALEASRLLGCEALQILPYVRHHQPSAEELASFDASRRALGVKALLVHSRFVPNLASSNFELRSRSVGHLKREMALASALGGDGYVIHGGAYSPGGDFEGGLAHFVDSVIRAVDGVAGRVPIYLENVPGGGRRMGGSLEELARLYGALSSKVEAVGVCLDSAHAYAAGYDLATGEGAGLFLTRARRLLGADAVRAFHLNDTCASLGSHRENHAHWGRGRLGGEGLAALLEGAGDSGAVGILEMPMEGVPADRESLDFVRRLELSRKSR